MVKEEGLALTSSVSAFLGVTEPAMFGVNLPLKVPFFAAICTSSVLGAIIGANKVLGSVGVGGVRHSYQSTVNFGSFIYQSHYLLW